MFKAVLVSGFFFLFNVIVYSCNQKAVFPFVEYLASMDGLHRQKILIRNALSRSIKSEGMVTNHLDAHS